MIRRKASIIEDWTRRKKYICRVQDTYEMGLLKCLRREEKRGLLRRYMSKE